MFDELRLRGRLCEHVSRVIFRVNGMDSNLALIDAIPEVVVLDINVFGVWMDLGNGSNLKFLSLKMQQCTLGLVLPSLKLSMFSSLPFP